MERSRSQADGRAHEASEHPIIPAATIRPSPSEELSSPASMHREQVISTAGGQSIRSPLLPSSLTRADQHPPLQAPLVANEDQVGAVVVDDVEQSPRVTIPTCFEQAKKLVRFSPIDNTTCKAIPKGIKVTGAQNSKLVTKLKILAVKMTQRQFCVNDALELVEKIEASEDVSLLPLTGLRFTAVLISKNTAGVETIGWIRGDLPFFDGEEVQVGEPMLGESTALRNQREPPFEASEYCRLLHVLAGARMTTARTHLMVPITREELDADPIDPWTDHIAPLFNDDNFKPIAISVVAGGVTRADIAAIDPSKRPHIRHAGVLSRKFAEFKSNFGTCLSHYQASGHNEPEEFVHFSDNRAHIMYAFCFVKQNPVLEPPSTRALPTDAQREEGVASGTRPSQESSGPLRKRRREGQEINSIGLDALSSAFKPRDEEVARATEEAERDKVRYEASEAKGRSAQALLSAIAQAKEMESQATTDEERAAFADVVKRLVDNLTRQL